MKKELLCSKIFTEFQEKEKNICISFKYTNYVHQKILLCSPHCQTMKKNNAFQLFCSISSFEASFKKTNNLFGKVQLISSKNHIAGISEGERNLG